MDKQEGLRVTRAKKRLMSDEIETNSRPGTPTRETRSRKNSTSTPDKSLKPLRGTPDPVLNSPARRTTRRTSVNTNTLAEVAKSTKFETLVEEETTNASSAESTNRGAIKIKDEPADEIEQPTPDANNTVTDRPKSNGHHAMTEKSEIKEEGASPAVDSSTEKLHVEENLPADKRNEAIEKQDSVNEPPIEKSEKHPQELQANEEKEAQLTENTQSTPKVKLGGETVKVPETVKQNSGVAEDVKEYFEKFAAAKKHPIVRINRYDTSKISEKKQDSKDDRVENLENVDTKKTEEQSKNGEHSAKCSDIGKDINASEDMRHPHTQKSDTKKSDSVADVVKEHNNNISTAKENGVKAIIPEKPEITPLNQSDTSGVVSPIKTSKKEHEDKINKNETSCVTEDKDEAVSIETIKNRSNEGEEELIASKNDSIKDFSSQPLSKESNTNGSIGFLDDKTVPLHVAEKNDGAANDATVNDVNTEEKKELPSNKNDTIEDIVNKSLPKEDYTNLSFLKEAEDKSLFSKEGSLNQLATLEDASPTGISKKKHNDDKTVSFVVTEKNDEAEKTVYPRTPFSSKLKISVNEEDSMQESFQSEANSSLDHNSTLDMMRKGAASINTPWRAKLGDVVPSSTPIYKRNSAETLADDGMSLRSGKKYTSPLSSPISENDKKETNVSKGLSSSQLAPVTDAAIARNAETSSQSPHSSPLAHVGKEATANVSKGLTSLQSSLVADNYKEERATVRKRLSSPVVGNSNRTETAKASENLTSPPSSLVINANTAKEEKTTSVSKRVSSPQPSPVEDVIDKKQDDTSSGSQQLLFQKSWYHCVEGKAGPETKIDSIKSLADERSTRYESDDNEENTDSMSYVERLEEEENVDEEDLQEEENKEESQENSLLENEAIEVNNYCSGDSLTESEKREIEENEIPEHGLSLGSSDTEEEFDEEEDSNRDSFIVSDAEDLSRESQPKQNFKRIRPMPDSTDESQSALVTSIEKAVENVSTQSVDREVNEMLDEIFDGISDNSDSKKTPNNNLNSSQEEEKSAHANRHDSIEERLIYQSDSSDEETQSTIPPKVKNLESIVVRDSDEDLDSKKTRPHSLSFQGKIDYFPSSDDDRQETEKETKLEVAQTLVSLGTTEASKNASFLEQISMNLSEINKKAALRANNSLNIDKERNSANDSTVTFVGIKRRPSLKVASSIGNDFSIKSIEWGATKKNQSGDQKSPGNEKVEKSLDGNKSLNISGINKHRAGSDSTSEDEGLASTSSNNTKHLKKASISRTQENTDSESDDDFNILELSKTASTAKKFINKSAEMQTSIVTVLDSADQSKAEEEANLSKNIYRSPGEQESVPVEANERVSSDEKNLKKFKRQKEKCHKLATSLTLPDTSDIKPSTARKRKSAAIFGDSTAEPSVSFMEAVRQRMIENREKDEIRERNDVLKKRKRSPGSFSVQEISPNAEPNLVDPKPHLKKIKISKSVDENTGLDTKSVKKILDYCEAVLDANEKAKFEERFKNKKLGKKNKKEAQRQCKVEQHEQATEQDKSEAVEDALNTSENMFTKHDKNKKKERKAAQEHENLKAAVEHALKASMKIRLEGLGNKKNVCEPHSQQVKAKRPDRIAENTQQQASSLEKKIVRKIKTSAGMVSEIEISQNAGQKPERQKTTFSQEVPSASGKWLEEDASPSQWQQSDRQKKKPRKLNSASGIWLDEPVFPPPVMRINSGICKGLRKIASTTGLWLEEILSPPPMKRIEEGARAGARKIASASGLWVAWPLPSPPARRIARVFCGGQSQIHSTSGLWLEESASADVEMCLKRKRIEEPVNVLPQPKWKVVRMFIEEPVVKPTGSAGGSKPKNQKSNPVIQANQRGLEFKQKALHREQSTKKRKRV